MARRMTGVMLLGLMCLAMSIRLTTCMYPCWPNERLFESSGEDHDSTAESFLTTSSELDKSVSESIKSSYSLFMGSCRNQGTLDHLRALSVLFFHDELTRDRLLWWFDLCISFHSTCALDFGTMSPDESNISPRPPSPSSATSSASSSPMKASKPSATETPCSLASSIDMVDMGASSCAASAGYLPETAGSASPHCVSTNEHGEYTLAFVPSSPQAPSRSRSLAAHEAVDSREGPPFSVLRTCWAAQRSFQTLSNRRAAVFLACLSSISHDVNGEIREFLKSKKHGPLHGRPSTPPLLPVPVAPFGSPVQFRIAKQLQSAYMSDHSMVSVELNALISSLNNYDISVKIKPFLMQLQRSLAVTFIDRNFYSILLELFDFMNVSLKCSTVRRAGTLALAADFLMFAKRLLDDRSQDAEEHAVSLWLDPAMKSFFALHDAIPPKAYSYLMVSHVIAFLDHHQNCDANPTPPYARSPIKS